jgi:hypothetical protein
MKYVVRVAMTEIIEEFIEASSIEEAEQEAIERHCPKEHKPCWEQFNTYNARTLISLVKEISLEYFRIEVSEEIACEIIQTMQRWLREALFTQQKDRAYRSETSGYVEKALIEKGLIKPKARKNNTNG